MNKIAFDHINEMLIDVERQMLLFLQKESDDAKYHLQSVLNNHHNEADFILACNTCNSIETDKRNMEKALYTLFRMTGKYKRRVP